MIIGKLPYRFRHGLVNFWGPGDADDGFGPGGTSGDMGATGGTGNNSGTGPGGGGYGPDGLVDLGPRTGGMSTIGKDGQFTGISDPSLGFVGTVAANMATNLGIALGKVGKSTALGKLGLTSTALSNPGMVAVAGLALGIKSVSQALSTPGLTDDDKAQISKAATTMGSMTPEEKAELSSQVEGSIGGDGVDLLTNQQNTEATGVAPTEQPTRPIWDDFVNEFYGTGQYKVPEQYASQSGGGTQSPNRQLVEQTYQEMFGRPGDEAGIQYWTNQLDSGQMAPENLKQAFTTSAQEIASGMKGTQSFGKSAKDLTYDSANHMANAGLDYQSGIQGAMDNQDIVLDRLLADSNQGSGLYNPINFKFMGNDVSFVPKSNMAQAAQQADFSKQRFDNTTSGLDKILASSQLTDPSNAGLKYLESLLKVADSEESRNQNDIANALQKLGIEYGKDVADDRIKAGEASTLQKLGELIKVGSSAYDLGSDWGLF